MLVTCPDWLTVNARVRKVGDWPRVLLPDGATGTVTALDIYEGHLRWFTVVWDNHPDYPHGVHHYG